MNIEEFNKIIKKNIKSKNFEKVEWDSLAILGILMDLEKKAPNKISTISKISEANTYKKMLKLLKTKKIIQK